jgi:hypothetical protein
MKSPTGRTINLARAPALGHPPKRKSIPEVPLANWLAQQFVTSYPINPMFLKGAGMVQKDKTIPRQSNCFVVIESH